MYYWWSVAVAGVRWSAAALSGDSLKDHWLRVSGGRYWESQGVATENNEPAANYLPVDFNAQKVSTRAHIDPAILTINHDEWRRDHELCRTPDPISSRALNISCRIRLSAAPSRILTVNIGNLICTNILHNPGNARRNMIEMLSSQGRGRVASGQGFIFHMP